MKPCTTFLRLFLLLTIITSTAFAGQATANLTVTTQVEASCSTFNVSNIAFAAYSGTAINQTGTVTINCIAGASYDISMGAGLGAGATVAARYLTNQTSGMSDQKLEYKLYSDSGRTVLWGDGTAGTSTVAGTATGADQVHTIYGTVTGGQTGRKVGTYQDTVVVTLTFN
ncbi:spore coat U domain-containing protein [Oxalobacteraceae bacterium R-40]|uniref:Spore coat U domain-containing protein n=1 Tax=Keguizhuia sedimenti TaxID=3064264 RepID=A0ABU1BPG5_9BURK|nr:spore coat U domain-containing protein [Oxalobacteraceae bacterium R-40]